LSATGWNDHRPAHGRRNCLAIVISDWQIKTPDRLQALANMMTFFQTGITRNEAPQNRAGARGRTALPVVLAIVVLAGAGLAAFWFFHKSTAGKTAAEQAAGEEPAGALSPSTRTVLDGLKSPVEIRYYSLLDPAGASSSLVAFAGRVNRLLDEFEQEGHGRITVTRYDAFSTPVANSALADGITAFNLDKGNGCFLGIAVICNQQRESLAELSPEWESALEADVSRAIERVAAAAETGAMQSPAGPAPASTTSIAEVKRAIPDIASVSLEDGTRILRESALKDFKEAVKAMNVKVAEAEDGIKAAQGKSEAEQKAALRHLQAVQTEQTEILKQIAARSQAQIQAFQELKNAAH
jgi:ABC-type uncharacterized transport system